MLLVVVFCCCCVCVVVVVVVVVVDLRGEGGLSFRFVCLLTMFYSSVFFLLLINSNTKLHHTLFVHVWNYLLFVFHILTYWWLISSRSVNYLKRSFFFVKTLTDVFCVILLSPCFLCLFVCFVCFIDDFICRQSVSRQKRLSTFSFLH